MPANRTTTRSNRPARSPRPAPARSPHPAPPNASLWVKLFGLDVRTLAMTRMALASVLLLNLVDRARDLEAMYTDAGIVPRHVVSDFYQASDIWWWSLHMLDGSFAFQALLLGLAALLAGALLVGFQTRWATILSWVLLASLHIRMPLLVTGGDALLCMLLFWAMFLPWGHCWSLDARRRHSSKSGPSAGLHESAVLDGSSGQDGSSTGSGASSGAGGAVAEIVFTPASAAMLLQVGVMYLMTGWGKCNTIWFSGEAIHNALSYEMIARPLGRELLAYPQLLRWLTWATLALELVGPWLLFCPIATRRVRTWTALALVALHIGIELTMRVTIFSFVSLAALTLFFPPEIWDPAWWKRRFRSTDSAAPDPAAAATVISTSRGWPARARNALVLVLLVYVLIANIDWQFGAGSLRKFTGSWLSRPAELLNFGQRWTMFVRPDATDYRFAAVARLEDGSVVDVLRDGCEVDFSRARDWVPRMPTQRWMLAFRELADDDNNWFRHSAAEYFYRQWNQRQADKQRIEILDLVVVQVRPWFEGASSPPMVRLAQVDSLQQGPHRNGKRHGNWVLRYADGQRKAEGRYEAGRREGSWVFYHENGRRSAEGQFSDDKESGTWTHWLPDGRKEGEGTYVEGRMHGPWTFWYEDGRRLEVMYDRDRPVQTEGDAQGLSAR